MKRIMVFFILLGLLSGCTVAEPAPAPQPQNPSIQASRLQIQSMREFAQRSAAEFFRDSTKNENYSPLSLSMALSMLLQGAEGQTRDEILTVLGFEGADIEEVNQVMTNLMDAFSQESEEGTLLIGNAVFSEERFPMKDSFIKKMEQDYRAFAQSLPLKEKSSVGRINEFISEHTADKIQNAYDPSPNSEDVLLLINTLYADLPWYMPFSEELTKPAIFYAPDGQIETPFMNKEVHSSYEDKEFYRSASLILGKDMQMTFVLPKEGLSPQDLLLKEGFLAHLGDDGQYSQLSWSIPKFSFETTLDLKNQLKELGMKRAFETDAQFPGISDIPTMVSSVIQNTYVDLTEEGVEAAAATIIAVAPTSAPPANPIPFVLNRPFLYLIESKEGVICFMGIVQNPSTK
ncbi:MAG: serpin family protein [Tissierellia bacterium]|nr:serpin family protein [Bacillota bacterium]NLL22285.1 serpin family protein [Tissierellia bacterium]